MASSCSRSYISSQETINFGRICRIVVDVLRDVLWQVLIHEIPPADLPNKVQTNQNNLRNLDDKIKIWLLGISPDIPTAEKFDVSSLYTLIRNLCSQVPAPSTQWGKPPPPSGTSLGDDIERVRGFRNTLYGHATRAAVDTTDYNNICRDIKNVVSRFDVYFSCTSQAMKCNFESEIDTILTCSMDKALEEKYIDRMKEIAVLLECTETVKQEDIEDLRKCWHKTDADIAEIKETLKMISDIMEKGRIGGQEDLQTKEFGLVSDHSNEPISLETIPSQLFQVEQMQSVDMDISQVVECYNNPKSDKQDHPDVLGNLVNVSGSRHSDIEQDNFQQDSSNGGDAIPQSRHPLFEQYHMRLVSYATWRQFQQFDTSALAGAGFYYIGDGTVIRCFFCGTELINLACSDDPLQEHIKKSPNCGYLKQKLGEQELEAYKKRLCNESQYSQQTYDQAAEQPSTSSSNHRQWNVPEHIRSPQYQAYSVRLASFARWPSDIKQRLEQVADAGFYYTGLQDGVRCFACDGGLKTWEPDDNPWIEHARWFPQCPFIKRVKGQEFIDVVHQMKEESDEEENAVVHSTFQPNNSMADGPFILKNEMNFQTDQVNESRVLETVPARSAIETGYPHAAVTKVFNELLTKGLLLALQQENKKLRRIMQCISCRKKKRDILLLPCKHFCLCSTCARTLSKCPLCSKMIRKKMKACVI